MFGSISLKSQECVVKGCWVQETSAVNYTPCFFIKCPVIGELVAALARLAASLGPYGKFPCIEVYAKGVINQDVLSCGQSL